MNRSLPLAIVAFVLSAGLYAQDIKPCGTTEAYMEILNNNPEIKAQREASEKEWAEIDEILHAQGYRNTGKSTGNQKADNINKAQGVIYYIPVVFHILHQNGSENISDAQVYSCIDQVNKDFSSLTADTANTQTPFKGLEADVEIQFRLATIDPNGNCTNGINRYYDPNTNWVKGSTPYNYTWNRTKYYNVYVVKTITSGGQQGIAGYSSFPGTNGASADVTVMLHNYVGNMGTSSPGNSHTFTHENGHFFNLYHIWDCCTSVGTACGTDAVGDTPQTKGYSPGGCPSGTGVQICNAGVSENINNYMDYSYCYTMFTAGQATRMRNTIINNVGNVGRQNLGSASNGIATGITTPQVCVPVPNFHATARTVCPNYVITFSDSSSNARPTSWNWSFPGGTFQNGTTATDSMPKVSYAAAGTYAVSYTATTSAGSAPITKNAYINVLSNVASYNAQFVEGFETTTLPGTDWNVYNGGGNDWTVSSAAAATGTKSTKLDNMTNPAGNVSILESTSFDISGFITPKLSFKYAYKLKATGDNDRLQVLTSTDCGSTWVSRWSRNSTTLANVTPPSTSAFTPTSGQFATYTVNINGVAGSTNVRFRWVFTSDYGGNGVVGNNLFMDDINLWDASLGITGAEELVSLVIYPNPSSGSVTLDMNLAEGHTISVNVTDVLGRSIESIPSKAYATGELSLSIGKEKVYQPGVYFVNMDVDGKQITRKVIIQ